jgi:hypothetical protein
MTEGTPFAFRGCPGIYEEVRAWLSRQLGVCPKEITLLGSGRLGFSLAAPPRYGTPFGKESDLDFSIVSQSLFGELAAAFSLWENDYKTSVVAPRNPRERSWWDGNLEFGHCNLPRGFLDANKVPNFDRYPVARRINQTMWVLTKKLEVTHEAPAPRKASVRVYRSWHALVQRVSLNLHLALSEP